MTRLLNNVSSPAWASSDAAPCINGALGDSERTHQSQLKQQSRSYSSVARSISGCYRALSTQLCNSLNQLLRLASSHMASYFVAQLKDMFFGLVDRVTGYGWSESQDGAGKCSSIIAALKKGGFEASSSFLLTTCRCTR